MKNILLILNLFFCVIACKNIQKNQGEDVQITPITEENSSQSDSSYDIIDKNKSKCLKSDIQMKEAGTEWQYCPLASNVKLVIITSFKDNIKYQEIFGLQNNQLVYAFESMAFNYKDTLNQMVWNCKYRLKDNKVIDYHSFGHGESEADGWKPESIFDQWQTRIEGYKKLNKI